MLLSGPPAFHPSHDLMYPATTRRETGMNRDNPLPQTPPSIRHPSSISPLSSPTSSHPIDERRNTSEWSRLPLPMSVPSIVVDKDTLPYPGGIFSDTTCTEAKRWVGEPRNVERVSTLELAVQGGDIFLFRCRGLISRLQQWVLRSEWDHVGVVSSFIICLRGYR